MRRWDNVLQGRETEIGAPAEKKVVETWSVLGDEVGVRKLLLWGWRGTMREGCGGGRGNGVSQAKGVAEPTWGVE